jgi:hypothetical protein
MKFSDAARLPRKGPWPFSGQSGFFKRPLRLLLESKLLKNTLCFYSKISITIQLHEENTSYTKSRVAFYGLAGLVAGV